MTNYIGSLDCWLLCMVPISLHFYHLKTIYSLKVLHLGIAFALITHSQEYCMNQPETASVILQKSHQQNILLSVNSNKVLVTPDWFRRSLCDIG